MQAERGVRVAVATQVGDGRAVAGGDERGDEVPPGAAEVTHAGDQDDEGAVGRTVDGVRDPALRPVEELDVVRHDQKANAISQLWQEVG
ncbi:hypothetical protein CELD12_08900 [Cellulomonas sp. NTE-D12]|nr:hypothetical protein CELD12_08900 [Cellulomonas sp. NTE-D12]